MIEESPAREENHKIMIFSLNMSHILDQDSQMIHISVHWKYLKKIPSN